MNYLKSKKSYIETIKEFLAFLQTLWGMLAGISIFFPLSNSLLNAIPMCAYKVTEKTGCPFDILSPNLITTIATVVTLFVILVTFTGRDQFRDSSKKPAMIRNAWLSFGVGILSLLTYIVVYYIYDECCWECAWVVLHYGSEDPRKLFFEIPLLITYVTFFSLFTRAFMILGMIEFFGKSEAQYL